MEMQQSPTSSESKKRVFLTGAFGSVGEFVLRELLALGYEVVCFDKASPATQKKAAKLSRALAFKTVWGDLTDRAGLMTALGQADPNIVTHVAAVIPPLSFKNPDLAKRVNVEGTRNLVAAAEYLGKTERFVLVSSYSVHGPCNPHTNPSPWTSSSPLNPQDDYANHKAQAEEMVKSSALPSCIVRLCAVFPVEQSGMDPDNTLFSFVLPYDRREHAIDVRDAGLAIAKASHLPNLEGRIFDVGGGDGWFGIGGELASKLVSALGIAPMPREATRMPDPKVDDSWFYENWVDTSESQAVLGYQRYTFDEYLAELKRRLGPARLILPLLAGALRKKMLKLSPYYGKPQMPDSRPFAEAAADVLNRPRR